MNIGHSQVLTAKSSVPNAQISYEVKNDTLPDGVTFDKANHRLIYSDIPVEQNTTIEIAATSTFTNSSGTIILTTSEIDIVVLPRVEDDYSVFTLLGIDLKLTNTYSIYCQKDKVKINFISPNTFPLTPDYDSNSPLILSVDFSGGTSIFDITP
jgi:hypothetical protein